MSRLIPTAACAAFLCTAALGETVSVPPAKADTVVARPAYNFVNAVGINTHFNWGGSIYANNYDRLSSELGELGVKHIREAPGVASVRAQYLDLWQRFGIRLTALIDSRTGSGASMRIDPTRIRPMLTDLQNGLPSTVVQAVEGINEWNLMEINYNYLSWPQEDRNYQMQLSYYLKMFPTLATKPLIGPSIAYVETVDYFRRLGDMSMISTRANMHIYTGRFPMSDSIAAGITNSRISWPTQKFYVTEFGFNISGNSPYQAIDENTRVKYLARTLAEIQLRTDVEKVYYYQLIDDFLETAYADPDGHRGLIDYYLNRTPAYYSMRNTMQIMCDDRLTFAADSLNYSLTGQMSNVRQLLFEKNNGSFYLVTWIDATNYNNSGQVVVPPQSVTLSLGNTADRIRLYRPSDPTRDLTVGNRPISTYTSVNSIGLQVLDNLTILEITPAGKTLPGLPAACAFTAS